jgi:hypothetical protein
MLSRYLGDRVDCTQLTGATFMDEPLFVRHPSVGLMMARYIAGFAVTELLVSTVFARIIGDDGTATHAIFHRLRNFTERIETLNEIASISTAKDANPVLAIIETIKAANKRRNILAHGVWFEDSDGSLIVRTNLADKRKLTRTEISEALLEKWLSGLTELNQGMLKLGFTFPGIENGLRFG